MLLNEIKTSYIAYQSGIILFDEYRMEFSLNGVELSLNSVNSGNSENLRNH